MKSVLAARCPLARKLVDVTYSSAFEDPTTEAMADFWEFCVYKVSTDNPGYHDPSKLFKK